MDANPSAVSSDCQSYYENECRSLVVASTPSEDIQLSTLRKLRTDNLNLFTELSRKEEELHRCHIQQIDTKKFSESIVAELEESRAELRQSKNSVEELHGELSAMRLTCAEAQGARDALIEQLEGLRTRIGKEEAIGVSEDKLSVDVIKELQTRNRALIASNTEAQNKIAELQEELSKSASELDSLRKSAILPDDLMIAQNERIEAVLKYIISSLKRNSIEGSRVGTPDLSFFELDQVLVPMYEDLKDVLKDLLDAVTQHCREGDSAVLRLKYLEGMEGDMQHAISELGSANKRLIETTKELSKFRERETQTQKEFKVIREEIKTVVDMLNKMPSQQTDALTNLLNKSKDEDTPIIELISALSQTLKSTVLGYFQNASKTSSRLTQLEMALADRSRELQECRSSFETMIDEEKLQSTSKTNAAVVEAVKAAEDRVNQQWRIRFEAASSDLTSLQKEVENLRSMNARFSDSGRELSAKCAAAEADSRIHQEELVRVSEELRAVQLEYRKVNKQNRELVCQLEAQVKSSIDGGCGADRCGPFECLAYITQAFIGAQFDRECTLAAASALSRKLFRLIPPGSTYRERPSVALRLRFRAAVIAILAVLRLHRLGKQRTVVRDTVDTRRFVRFPLCARVVVDAGRAPPLPQPHKHISRERFIFPTVEDSRRLYRFVGLIAGQLMKPVAPSDFFPSLSTGLGEGLSHTLLRGSHILQTLSPSYGPLTSLHRSVSASSVTPNASGITHQDISIPRSLTVCSSERNGGYRSDLVNSRFDYRTTLVHDSWDVSTATPSLAHNSSQRDDNLAFATEVLNAIKLLDNSVEQSLYQTRYRQARS